MHDHPSAGTLTRCPEEFGEVTDDVQLFDRQRVADIVNGDI
jgi:hypothetical protein